MSTEREGDGASAWRHPPRLGSSSGASRALSLGVAVALALALFVVPTAGAWSPAAGAPRLSAPRPSAWTGVVSIVQSPSWITQGSNVTVGIEIANPSDVKVIAYTFCQLWSFAECYIPPVVMSANGSGWFTGTTKVMSYYNHLYPGDIVGYNITVSYENGTNVSEPSAPQSPFPGLTVGQAVVTPGASPENLFSVTVRNPVFGISGTVDNATTGAPVVGANVTLTSTGTNTTTTNSQGAYSFGRLLNGSYTLTVSKAGYSTQTKKVTLSGSNATQGVELSNTTSGTNLPIGGGSAKSDLLGGMDVEYVGLGVAAIVIVVGVLMFVFRRGPGPPARSDPAASPPNPPS